LATQLIAGAKRAQKEALASAPPAFWEDAKRQLSARDPILARIIREHAISHPLAHLVSRGDCFATLARSIVGQQISVKAADSIWKRLVDRCPEFTPVAVARRRHTTLRACGLSERKAEYLRDLARHFADRRVDPAAIALQSDDEIVEVLTDIRGIGRWTAEMFLIFNLLRPDVYPVDDLGLVKAVSRFYFDGEPCETLMRGNGRKKLEKLGARWAPYRSVATWYLWRSLDPVPVEY